MSGNDSSHPDAEALDRYRRRAAPAAEVLAVDAHIARCDRCYEAVRAESDTIELPPDEGDAHLTYAELEAFVDGRADALDRELIAAHAAACTRCSGELTDLAATRDSLVTRSSRAVPPVRFRRPRT
jgi:anti-sigma factor RsiW